jgi:predicted Zn-dependent peptidase
MKKSVLPAILLIVFVFCGRGAAQNMPEPYQEKLLNGLKVLVWNDPAADKVTLKLRIHSGAAFDPKDKMGVMALLADILFPDPQTFNYFEEDLDGKLEVTSNYDYIQITATGKADEFVNMLDTVRAGIITTPITQENFVKVRDARLERIKADVANSGLQADRAAAKRLLGEFPYGRPDQGTPESLVKIDRFDLVGAKDKFLDADNATLVIVGKIDPRFAVKAAKQMLGSWGKSEGLVPATFAQPGEPDTKTQLIDQPGAATAEVRFAVRGLASNDNDNAALVIWASAFEKKINAALLPECGSTVKVVQRSHVLPGLLLISGTFPIDAAGKCTAAVKNILAKADTDKIKPEDFTAAQNGILQAIGGANPDRASDLWLGADTFKWGKPGSQLALIKAATPADGDKVAARVFWKAPVVSAIAGDAARIKPQFDGSTQFALRPEQEDQIKKEVLDFMSSWRASAEKLDVEENLKHYAPKLETYYKETNKDRNDIKAQRVKAFERYDTIKIDLSRLSVRPETETSASVIFDKKWQYQGMETISTGAAQQLMRLVKTDGQWQIVSEKDLLLYGADTRQILPPAKP